MTHCRTRKRTACHVKISNTKHPVNSYPFSPASTVLLLPMMTSCLPLKSMPPYCGDGVGVYVPITKLLLKATVPLEPQAVFIAPQSDTTVNRRCTTTAVVFAANMDGGELTWMAEGSTAQRITESGANGKDPP